MKILIIKTSSLGDIIQSFPVLDLLHQKFPMAQIDWVVETPFQEILKAHPKVYRVIGIEIRKWRRNFYKYRLEIIKALQILRKERYDLLIDLQGNFKSGVLTKIARAQEKIGMTFSSAAEWINSLFLTHRYSLNQKNPISFQYLSIVAQHLKIEAKGVTSDLLLEISKKEEDWIASVLSKHKRIMVCPGSCWKNKQLPFSTWIKILKREPPPCHFYFVWGSEKEKEKATAFHQFFFPSSTLLPRLSLPVWQRLMVAMDFIYTVDSSALYLAGTTKTPTYSFFGPSVASVYKPLGTNHRAFQASCPYGKTFIKRCPILRTCSTGACLKDFSNLQRFFHNFEFYL